MGITTLSIHLDYKVLVGPRPKHVLDRHMDPFGYGTLDSKPEMPYALKP